MRLNKRLRQISESAHNRPTTKDNPFGSLIRYVYFNIKHRIVKESTYDWIGGLKLPLRLGDAAMVGNYYFILIEFDDSLFTLHLLKKQDLFVDVGANLGHYSLLSSKIIGNQSIAIEPVPSTYRRLQETVELNNLSHLIKSVNVGVGSREEELWFSSEKNNMNRVVDANYPTAVQVRVTTLDNVVGELMPTLIKIDVEGFEKFVIEGGAKTMSNSNLLGIILELNGSGSKYGVDENEIHLQLLDLGFMSYVYSGETRTLTKIEGFNKNSFNTLYLKNLEEIESRLISSKPIKVGNKLF